MPLIASPRLEDEGSALERYTFFFFVSAHYAFGVQTSTLFGCRADSSDEERVQQLQHEILSVDKWGELVCKKRPVLDRQNATACLQILLLFLAILLIFVFKYWLFGLL